MLNVYRLYLLFLFPIGADIACYVGILVPILFNSALQLIVFYILLSGSASINVGPKELRLQVAPTTSRSFQIVAPLRSSRGRHTIWVAGRCCRRQGNTGNVGVSDCSWRGDYAYRFAR